MYNKNHRKACLWGLLLALLLGAGPLAPATYADTQRTIVVDAVDDNDPGDGCTLREAIDLANWNWGPGTHPNGCTVTESGSGAPTTYTINLPAYTYTLSGPGSEDNNWSGDLDVSANVRIIGAAAALTIIDGSDDDRVFHLDPAGDGGYVIDIQGLTIRNGSEVAQGAGIHNGADNTVNIRDCTIADNEVARVGGAAGGGIFSDGGVLNVIDSTIADNRSATNLGNTSQGGGIHTANGSLTITGSTIDGNTAYVTAGPGSLSQGGGINSVLSTLIISDTAITGNETTNPYDDEYMSRGGGIYAAGGTVSIAASSVISGNLTKDRGGGIYSDVSTVSVSASTIRNNRAADGAGIYCFGLPGTAAGGIHAPLAGATITSGSIITGNVATDRGGGIFNWYTSQVTVDGSTISNNEAKDGGGIYNQGQLTIQNQSLVGGEGTGNETSGYGGGIYNDGGNLTLVAGKVSDNICDGHGAGIYNEQGVTLLNGSDISGNDSGRHGGGIYSDGDAAGATLMLNKCTVSGNTAGNVTNATGGGLYLYYSHANIANSTISGNRSIRGKGGGIGTLSDEARTINLVHCTIYANQAGGHGGGMQLEGTYTVNISNTIVAGNSAEGDGPDVYGEINSQDYNLIQDTTDTTIVGTVTHNITGVGPLLGPLADNGGDTRTHALLNDSLAMDAIPEDACPLPDDQRGVTRPQREGCDIGAYEAELLRVFLPLILLNYD